MKKHASAADCWSRASNLGEQSPFPYNANLWRNYEPSVCAHSAVNRVFLTCLYVIRQVTVIYSYKREWISIVTSNRLCSNA